MKGTGLEILFEDNHLVIVNKTNSDLVQKDQTGDLSLDEKLKIYLKEKYDKPGDAFIGIPHRLDRPVSGLVIYAKTSKALSRMSLMFKEKNINKIYWAIVKNKPPKESDILTHYLVRNTKQNKSYALNSPKNNAKESSLEYKIIAGSDRYFLLEINLFTGRHHQIRCQLAKIGCPIKGDRKYGFAKSNPDGGISLHARKVSFLHPVKNEPLEITAPLPADTLWKTFESIVD